GPCFLRLNCRSCRGLIHHHVFGFSPWGGHARHLRCVPLLLAQPPGLELRNVTRPVWVARRKTQRHIRPVLTRPIRYFGNLHKTNLVLLRLRIHIISRLPICILHQVAQFKLHLTRRLNHDLSRHISTPLRLCSLVVLLNLPLQVVVARQQRLHLAVQIPFLRLDCPHFFREKTQILLHTVHIQGLVLTLHLHVFCQ